MRKSSVPYWKCVEAGLDASLDKILDVTISVGKLNQVKSTISNDEMSHEFSMIVYINSLDNLLKTESSQYHTNVIHKIEEWIYVHTPAASEHLDPPTTAASLSLTTAHTTCSSLLGFLVLAFCVNRWQDLSSAFGLLWILSCFTYWGDIYTPFYTHFSCCIP